MSSKMTSNQWDLRIDGDVIVYQAGFAADARGADTVAPSLLNIRSSINSLINKFPGKWKIYLSSENPKDNFRTEIVKDYKANRVKLRRPKFYKEMRAYLIKHRAEVVDWGEADDWLGINLSPYTVIASIDKDLLMIPCYHYRIHRGITVKAEDPGELELIKKKNKYTLEGYGFKWFCAQMLLGDKVDNIKAAKKGFGPRQIYDYLYTPGPETSYGYWQAVEHFYWQNGIEDRLDIQAKLLWIAREERQIWSSELANL